MKHSMRQAFSLVELSIVLVILGLLVGGVLTGQSLIRAAELRSVGTEYSRYTSAVHSFRDKYFSFPGDMNNATQFWGRMNNGADCLTNSSASVSTNGSCDGNGSGVMDMPGAASTSGESFQFWRQLALAGLIEGTFSGNAGSGSAIHTIFGTNSPRSKLSNGGWGMYRYGSSWAGDALSYAGNYGNAQFVFGASQTNALNEAPLLKPEEAWNIDTKLDDGRPGTGVIVARYWNNACANAASSSDYSSTYRLSDSNVQCMLYFRGVF